MRQFYIIPLALICFSYPITTVWLIMAGAPVSSINVAIKTAIMYLLVIALLAALPKGRITPIAIPLLAFFMLYGTRLLYDVLVLDILMIYQTKLYVFGYFFGLTMLPALVLALAVRATDVAAVCKTTFYMIFVANISLLIYAAQGGPIYADTAFSGRLEEAGEMEGTALLGPIYVGQMGAMLSAFAASKLATTYRMSFQEQVFYLGSVFIGGVNLLLGASRGPAVALALCLLVLFARRITGGGKGTRVAFRAWLYVGLFAAALTTLSMTDVIKIQLFERFELMFDDRMRGGTELRDLIYRLAWNDFLSAPFLGSSYVVSVGGYSPHNIILEALMATGIVGAIPFFLALSGMIWAVWHLVRGHAGAEGVQIAMVAICFFVLSMTSGAISDSPHFWAYLLLCCLLAYRIRAQAKKLVPARSHSRVYYARA